MKKYSQKFLSQNIYFGTEFESFLPQKFGAIPQATEIGGQEGPWPLLNLRILHRIVIFAIENHFSLTNGPPYF